jgi:hypothetical protein
MKKFSALIATALTLGLGACNMPSHPKEAPTGKTFQAQKAAEAAASITITDNTEIDNIKKRLELMSKPGVLMYIVLLNQAGQPIMYEGVVSKITSSGKQLTKPYNVSRKSQPAGVADTYLIEQAPSDNGLWGSSGNYIFYWNTEGAYRQWSGDYILSDKPLRLKVEPLVVSHADGK